MGICFWAAYLILNEIGQWICPRVMRRARQVVLRQKNRFYLFCNPRNANILIFYLPFRCCQIVFFVLDCCRCFSCKLHLNFPRQQDQFILFLLSKIQNALTDSERIRAPSVAEYWKPLAEDVSGSLFFMIIVSKMLHFYLMTTILIFFTFTLFLLF